MHDIKIATQTYFAIDQKIIECTAQSGNTIVFHLIIDFFNIKLWFLDITKIVHPIFNIQYSSQYSKCIVQMLYRMKVGKGTGNPHISSLLRNNVIFALKVYGKVKHVFNDVHIGTLNSHVVCTR